jgi:hypothetical protein
MLRKVQLKSILTLLLVLQLAFATAQVGDIKSSSSNNSTKSGGDKSSGNNAFLIYLFYDMLRLLPEWQQYKLTKRPINPYLVSVDVIAPVAIQPSRYYLFNPRIRGNWGLFSTDFRINYLIQETATGTTDLSSLDWQILQLNMVTTRNVIGRVGGGFMQENFGGRKSFFEYSFGLFVQSNSKRVGGSMEYRVAQDYETGVVPRREFSAQFEKRLSSKGYWNTYLTIGGVYQRYYESISVWGIQAGIAFRIHSPPFQGDP